MARLTRRVFVQAAAAVGPQLDCTAGERATLTATPPKRDATAALKALLGDPLRQASHLVKLAMLGAQHCRQRITSGIDTQCAIYVGTGLGELEKTRALFEQVMPPRQGFASPFDFINAAANMAAFYVAKTWGLSTRNLTVSDDEFSFETALHLAWSDIQHGARPQALVGGVDERYADRESQLRRMTLADNEIIGEGTGWLFLSSQEEQSLGELLFVGMLPPGPMDPASRIRELRSLAENNGLDCDNITLLPGFRMTLELQEQLAPHWPGAIFRPYVPWCGAFHTASAFGCARLFDRDEVENATAGDFLHIGINSEGRMQIIGLRRY